MNHALEVITAVTLLVGLAFALLTRGSDPNNRMM